jgi:hypothetical protein
LDQESALEDLLQRFPNLRPEIEQFRDNWNVGEPNVGPPTLYGYFIDVIGPFLIRLVVEEAEDPERLASFFAWVELTVAQGDEWVRNWADVNTMEYLGDHPECAERILRYIGPVSLERLRVSDAFWGRGPNF